MNFRKSPVLTLAGILLAAPVAAQSFGVMVNGQPANLEGQPPVYVGGHLLVPLAAVGRPIGAFLEWRPAQRTVAGQRGGHRFTLPIGSTTATVDGMVQTLETPARIAGGRTMVPLRFVATALGANVRYEAATRTVYVDSGAGNQRYTGNGAPPRPRPGRRGDAQGPIILSFSPRDQAVVRNGQTTIRVQFRDRGNSGIDPGSVQLLVNGLDVTDSANVTPRAITYTGRITPGPVDMRVNVADRAGNQAQARWTFTVAR